MNKKNLVRIILDSVMIVLLVLMYQARVVSLSFHEIGGLAACGLFVIHNGINRKWIAGVTKRLFTRPLPLKTRVGYAVDLLLLVSTVSIALSGIMISRTVLVNIYGDVGFWRPLHYSASAVALILVGVHLGLHWSFIRSMFTRLVRLPRVVARPLAVVCLAAVLALGAYSIATSSLVDWLADPFDGDVAGLSQGQGLGRHGGGGGGGGSSDENILEVVATYGSIMVAFAAATVLAENALGGRRKRARPGLQAAS